MEQKTPSAERDDKLYFTLNIIFYMYLKYYKKKITKKYY